MNLHCEKFDLWQTPTYITYMIYSNANGGYRGILYRYEQWILYQQQNTLNGRLSKSSAEEKAELTEIHMGHIRELKEAAKNNGTLTFYIL